MSRTLCCLGVALGLAATGCGDGEATRQAHRKAVLKALAEDFGQNTYAAFEAQANTLSTEMQALCGAPDEARLSAARVAWSAARQPWKIAEVIRFGPVVEYPERFSPKIDTWPVYVDAIEALVGTDRAVDAEAFASFGAVTRGLPMVEYLLWGTGDILSEPRRCQVALGASQDLGRLAGQLSEAWTREWVPSLIDPQRLPRGIFASPQDVIDEWVNRMAFTVENIRAVKLGKPLGDSTGGELQPQLIESRFSGRALQDAQDALRGVQRVWRGQALGLESLVRDRPDLVQAVDAAFEGAVAALGAVPEPLSATLEVNPEAVWAAQEALRGLQVVLQVDVAQALGVSITFNDNDGD